MTDITALRTEISQKYTKLSDKIQHKANPALLRYLSTPVPKSFFLDLIFRGNHKLNFNNRVTDRDIILIASALEKYEDVIVYFHVENSTY